MTVKKDCEKFTKGFCVPRDLVVNGELIKTVIEEDKAKAKNVEGGGSEYQDDSTAFRVGPRKEKRASVILVELIKQKRKEKVINRRREASGEYSDNIDLKISESEAELEVIEDNDFAGISGFSEKLFVDQLRIRSGSVDLKSCGFHNYNVNDFEYRSKVCGKIIHYQFDGNTRSGCLSVELIHEEFLTQESFLDCKPDQVTTYLWDIEIPDCGFDVLERDDTALNDPDKPPFLKMPEGRDGKDVAAFPPHSLDPEDPRSIWCRGLNHKLLAVGENVQIVNVYRKVECCKLDCGHPDCGVIVRLDENDPDDEKFYVSTAESCIDLMFKGPPPASQLPPQVEYCLGRCENPPVINSGGT